MFFFLALMPATAQRQMERLGRGVVVLHSATSQAYVSWRLLATDPAEVGFNLYRSANGGSGVKLNSQPLTNTTDFLDTAANFTVSNAWVVVPVLAGVEQSPSAPCGLAANAPVRQYLPLPLVNPGAFTPYDVKFCWVGDFDGDGEYDFLVDRLSTTGGKNQFLQAYKRDGTFLWQMDMGFNSTNTSNAYEPDAAAISIGDKDNVTVYDLDGDGRAEVVVRTANGTILANGTTIATNNNTSQFLSILDGLTGVEKARALIPNPYFADGPLNCHAGIVYFDGIHPSVLFSGENRVGSAAFQRLSVAWDFRDGRLTQRWLYQTPAGQNDSEGHQLRIADANHDGKDDLIRIGGVVSDSNGVPVTLYSTECAHGDRYHVTDIDPDRPGLEMYSIQQLNTTLLATELQDLGSGQLFKKWYSPGVVDVGRGIAVDISAAARGCEVYSTQPGIYDAKGNQIYTANVWAPEGIWWDADLTREFEDGAGSGALNPVINKFNPITGVSDRLFTVYNDDGAYSTHQAYGGRAAFWGDILGDWREEFIVVQSDYTALRLYTTKLPATNRIYCLMQNPQYRVQSTFKGYYQASYVDYFLGFDMPPPPPPPVSDARLVWRGSGTNSWDATSANWMTNNLWVSNTVATTYSSGDTVLFDASGLNTTVSLSGSLAPGGVTVHSPANYFFIGGGALTGAMKLTKAGAGKLFLAGTHSYSGATLVGEGALIVNGALSTSPVTVRGGIWLDGRLGGTGVVGSEVSIFEGAGVSPGQGTYSPGTLTISNSVRMAGRTLNDFDLSDDASGANRTNDLLVINGNLTLQGTNTFVIRRLNATLPAGSVYPLLRYSGTLTGGLSNCLVSGLSGVPFALTNPPGQIALVIKNYRSPAAVTWTGGGGGNAWDLLGTSNWLNGAAKDSFAPMDTVRFDNIGATNLSVTLVGDLNVGSLWVDSTSNYLLGGSGGIVGAGTLVKTNSGTLTLNALNNAFTGRTLLAGGTLVVPELDALGYPSPLGNPPGGSTNLVLSGNSTLRITGESYTDRGLTLSAGTCAIDVTNSSDQVTLAGVIAGGGALQKVGAGALALSANNTYTGQTLVLGGTLSLGGGTANQYGLGPGPGGNGNTTVTLSNATLTLFSDSGSYDTCYWNLIVPTNSAATLNGDDRCNLYGSLTGGGTLNFNVYYVRTELDGNWSAFTGQLNLGTDSLGGDFRIGNSYGYANAGVNLADFISAYHISGSPVAFGALSGSSQASLSGSAWTVGAKNTDATFAGRIAGSSITKVGTGAWTLTGSNYYAGTTTVSAGTLFVNGDNHSASGAVTVGASGTLGGTGVLGGATTVGGMLSPGVNGVGTLSFSNHLSLSAGSTVFMEINRNTGAKDLAGTSGTITYGGTLQVTNLAGTIVSGDSFKLFSAATYSGTFASLNLPPLTAGLAWDTAALATNGTLGVINTNVVANGPKTLLWRGDGATNAWDINITTNWLDAVNAPAVFANGDFVLFNDAGSNTVPVLLLTNLAPGSFTINAGKDFVLSGSGAVNGTNGLTKSGSGQFTLLITNGYTGATTITDGTLRLLGLGSGLAHRWSFNNSLGDSVGNSPATLVDVGTNNVILGAASVVLAGGARAVSDYVSLGPNLLPNTSAPVTLEIWATQNALQNWARIFDFGASTTEYLFMSWSQGTALTNDRVEWKDGSTSTSDNTCQPYALGTEFHVAMVLEPGAGAGGTTRVTWYRAASTNSTLGAARGTFNSTNTLAGFVNTNCWLGRSEYTGDNTASAAYNEVRLWSRALSAAELQMLHTNGPDAGMSSALPASTALTLSGSSAVLDLQNGPLQVIGSLAGAEGAEVKLATASLIAGGDNRSTVFAGFVSGTNQLIKTGSGTLELSGDNTASGMTVLSNGALVVNGRLAGPFLARGGTLGGTGFVAGAATINAGATLAPGNFTGTLTFSNALTLSAGCLIKFEISGPPLTNTTLSVQGNLAYGGALVVTNRSGLALSAGDRFPLLNPASHSGSFSSLTFPVLGANLAWDTNRFLATGTLAVVSTALPAFDFITPLSDGNFRLTFSGPAGRGYELRATTNLSMAPVTLWILLGSATFGTIPVVYDDLSATNYPQRFYQIRVP